jgi:monoterpene epsilon-lactone hydrolase
MTTETTDAAKPADFEVKGARRGLHVDGSVEFGRFALPYSTYASDVARQTFVDALGPPPPEADGNLLALRAHYAKQNDKLADRMRELFAVEVREERIAGVRAHRVVPAKARAGNADRVLICLHGGGFTWGADSGALVEAIPIAHQMSVEVVAVDYRMGPEHQYPAASEDVAAVYGALLERYAPEAIGIYGCSAGAILTAQAVAWLAKAGLPRPGAICMLGGGGGEMLGDSIHLAPALEGYERPFGAPLSVTQVPYFAGARMDDPCVFPGDHPDVIAQFPPTLLIAGGRDFAASSVTKLHLDLDAAGVETRLYIFDGLWHAFQIFPELPESQQVYEIMARFFDRHLAA